MGLHRACQESEGHELAEGGLPGTPRGQPHVWPLLLVAGIELRQEVRRRDQRAASPSSGALAVCTGPLL